ncbi:MAG: hypothetical protein M1167_02075 [Chloroflexi bacterium]|nr:hypothetical protein [Chloroflexota bacterium]
MCFAETAQTGVFVFFAAPEIVSQNLCGYFVFSIVEEESAALTHHLPEGCAETSVLLLGFVLGC